MSLLGLLRLVLGGLALRGVRWAYVAFALLALLYFPARVDFRPEPRPCQLAFSASLAAQSLTNYGHVVLFALFFVMTFAQFRAPGRSAAAWSALVTIGMGALVEIVQGLTGAGNCRSRDLIPDTVGIMIGVALVSILRRIGWEPRPTWSLFGWRG